MARRIVLALVLVVSVLFGQGVPAAPALAQGGPMVVAEGLNAPQGVLIAPDGSIWVVDSGIGGDTEVDAINPMGERVTATFGDTGRVIRIGVDGTQEVVATLPSILIGDEATAGARLAVIDDEVYVTNGVWVSDGAPEAEALPNTAAILRINADGSLTQVAETWSIEKESNPDGSVVESHPYGLAVGPDGWLWVADAGANTLLRVDVNSGAVELPAVFEPLPGAFPNPNHGGEMLTDAVPTGVVFDDDGNALVSLLSGFPFIPGSAKVLKVAPDGGVSVFADGLTMLTDLRRGPDGAFYAVQFAVFSDQGPEFGSGALVRLEEGGTAVPVVEGLAFPTSVDFNEAGDAYITIFGAGPPGAGQLIMVAGVASGMAQTAGAAATPAPTEEPAEEPAATPAPTAEPTEEPMQEPAATPVPTEEPAQEPMALPAATQPPAEEAPAPMTLPQTGGGAAGVALVAVGAAAAWLGSVALRRRRS